MSTQYDEPESSHLRPEQQIKWYDTKSGTAQRWLKRVKFFELRSRSLQRPQNHLTCSPSYPTLFARGKLLEKPSSFLFSNASPSTSAELRFTEAFRSQVVDNFLHSPRQIARQRL